MMAFRVVSFAFLFLFVLGFNFYVDFEKGIRFDSSFALLTLNSFLFIVQYLIFEFADHFLKSYQRKKSVYNSNQSFLYLFLLLAQPAVLGSFSGYSAPLFIGLLFALLLPNLLKSPKYIVTWPLLNCFFTSNLKLQLLYTALVCLIVLAPKISILTKKAQTLLIRVSSVLLALFFVLIVKTSGESSHLGGLKKWLQIHTVEDEQIGTNLSPEILDTIGLERVWNTQPRRYNPRSFPKGFIIDFQNIGIYRYLFIENPYIELQRIIEPQLSFFSLRSNEKPAENSKFAIFKTKQVPSEAEYTQLKLKGEGLSLDRIQENLSSTRLSRISVLKQSINPTIDENFSHIILFIVVMGFVSWIMGSLFHFFLNESLNSLLLGIAVGPIVFAYLLWSLQSLTNWPGHLVAIGLIFTLVILTVFKTDQTNTLDSKTSKLLKNLPWWELAIPIGIFSIWLFIKYLKPEAFWGEKTMDFSFLNYFNRSDRVFPLEDPWVSDSPMNYYYLGYYGWGRILSYLGISAGLGYTLVFSYLPVMIFASSRLLLRILKSSQMVEYLGALAVIFSSNLEAFNISLEKGYRYNFHDFWKTTRTLRPYGINEYPFWTILFNDFHPHIIGLSCFIASLAILYHQSFSLRSAAGKSVIEKGNRFLPFLSGFLMAIAISVNTWVVLVYIVVALTLPWFSLSKKNLINYVKTTLSSLFFLLPFFSVYFANPYGEKTHIRKSLSDFQVINIIEFFQHYGLLLFLPIAAIFMARFRDKATNWKVILGLFTVCVFSVVGSEVFIVSDKMNTLYKMNFLVYPILVCLSAMAYRSLKGWLGFVKWFFIILFFFVPSFFNAKGFIEMRRVPDHSASFYSDKYVQAKYRSDVGIINWLKLFAPLDSVIVEAQKDSYGDFGRINKHTGLQSLTGWRHHIKQRGLPWGLESERFKDLGLLYTGDQQQKSEVIKKYTINYIIISDLEKSAYRRISEFSEPFFRLVYRDRENRKIYQVVSSD